MFIIVRRLFDYHKSAYIVCIRLWVELVLPSKCPFNRLSISCSTVNQSPTTHLWDDHVSILIVHSTVVALQWNGHAHAVNAPRVGGNVIHLNGAMEIPIRLLIFIVAADHHYLPIHVHHREVLLHLSSLSQLGPRVIV